MITVKRYKTQKEYIDNRDDLPINAMCYIEETKRMYYQCSYDQSIL